MKIKLELIVPLKRHIPCQWCFLGGNERAPKDPILTFVPIYNCNRGSQVNAHDILCNIEEITIGKNQDFTPMTTNDLRLTFDPINGIDGLKLMHMHELHM